MFSPDANNETYIRDIIDRNNVRNKAEIEELIDIIASDIGSLTNPLKIANTFKTEKKVSVHQETIKNFLDYFEDAFLVSKAKRYDIKGKKYINTPMNSENGIYIMNLFDFLLSKNEAGL